MNVFVKPIFSRTPNKTLDTETLSIALCCVMMDIVERGAYHLVKYFPKIRWSIPLLFEKNISYCFVKRMSLFNTFFEFPFVKSIWHILCISFSLTPPKNVMHLFGTWLKDIPKNELRSIQVGVCAIIWAIWNVRNDFV